MKKTTKSADARVFLGWDEPALPSAVARIIASYREGDTLDLSRLIVVVPGERAGRRLIELFAFAADDARLLLTPPDLTTEGQLPELLYEPALPFADDLTQLLAWKQALVEMPEHQRRAFVPVPPAIDDSLRWLDLARMFGQLHLELGGDALDFAAVQQAGRNVPGFNEGPRWNALAALQARYRQLLERQKLIDMQDARLRAIESGSIRTDRQIVLLGTVDLNGVLKKMLAAVGPNVTPYVFAPADMADAFDSFGCLLVDRWTATVLPVDDDQIVQVEGPIDQAEAATAWLRQLSAEYGIDEVTIGVPDEALVPQLVRQLEQLNVASDWVEGARVGGTAPFRLLQAAVAAVDGDYDALAGILRHPDVSAWLSQDVDRTLLTRLDEYYGQWFPSKVDAKRMEAGPLHDAVQRIERWLSPLRKPLPLRQWSEPFQQVLETIYGESTLELDRPEHDRLHRAFRRLVARLDQATLIPPALDLTAYRAGDAFEVLLKPLADKAVPSPGRTDSLSILGWLELPFDDAPALIVTSFNDGIVPTNTSGDPFLPDAIRQHLGLNCDDRRLARDAYYASAIAHSRRELRLVLARKNADREPLRPSRLLFTGDDARVIDRARRYFDEGHADPVVRIPNLGRGLADIPAKSTFAVPPPEKKFSGDVFTVTDFKKYIACPYRYYLERVEKLGSMDDSARELDPSAFGTLVHQVVSDFGRDPSISGSMKAAAIEAYAIDRLDAFTQQWFGHGQHRPALRLQIEQARRRLRAFARHQAELTMAGWRIAYAENESDSKAIIAPFAVADGAVSLKGRIDRVDFHEQNGVVRIVDYKTADTAKDPAKAHYDNEAWIDLQLPLYRHLWPFVAPDVPRDSRLELAYFNLPKNDKSGIVLAEWDGDMLDTADERAREIIGGIRNNIFWPPADPAPEYDNYPAICLAGYLSKKPLESAEEERP